MKKLILLSIATLAVFTLSAQPRKGAATISGTFSYSITGNTQTSTTTSAFVIAPAVDYFTSEKWSMGGQIRFIKNANGRQFGLGFRNNYYLPISDKLYLSFNGLAEIVPGINSNDNFTFGLNVGITPTLNYYLSNHWSVSAAFGSAIFQFSVANSVITTALNIATAGGLTLGIGYTF